MSGLHIDEIAAWLQGVDEINDFKYYYFMLGAKKPTESRVVKGQPVGEVLDFLKANFIESTDSFVEVQKKAYKSGRHQVIVRKIAVTASTREITRIAVLDYSKLA